GLLAMLGVRRWIPESRDEHADRRWDFPGNLTLSIGLAALVFATIEGNTYGWWAQRADFLAGTALAWPAGWVSVIPVAYTLAVVLLTSFVRIERARVASGRSVLVDFTLYKIASFRHGNFAAMIVSLGEFGIVFVLPLFLQTVLGYSAWQTGLLLLALSGGAFLAGGSAMHLTRRFSARRVVSAGLLFEAVAIASLGAVISNSVTWHTMAPLLFIYGIGVGLATAQLTSVVLGDVPIAQSGQASGIQSTSRQMGAALGIAILGTVFVVGVQQQSSRRLDAVPGLSAARQTSIVRTIERSGGAIKPQYGKDAAGRRAHQAINESIVIAARTTGYVASLFVLLGFLASLRLPAPVAQPKHDRVAAAMVAEPVDVGAG
ncbi:MAG: MFS transporter, partial [Thermoleophilia bacterium]|nr:MFS transporter [Thermoleophilia bacterium]